jgi:hypothetical protein
MRAEHRNVLPANGMKPTRVRTDAQLIKAERTDAEATRTGAAAQQQETNNVAGRLICHQAPSKLVFRGV